MIDTFILLTWWGFALGFGATAGFGLALAVGDAIHAIVDAFMLGFRRGSKGRGE